MISIYKPNHNKILFQIKTDAKRDILHQTKVYDVVDTLLRVF